MQPIPLEAQDLPKGPSFVSKGQTGIPARRDSILRKGRMEQKEKRCSPQITEELKLTKTFMK